MAAEIKETLFANPTESYILPALRGVQAGREYYVAMCPMRIIPRVFMFDDEELPPQLRAQRTLNKARIPEMSRYLTENSDGYIFSSLTASIDAEVHFIPANPEGPESKMGQLVIPMCARILINDGQHRRAAIERAIQENHEIANESISVVFYIDAGLRRTQQMFADLNQNAIRASKSLEILYDHRDDLAALIRGVVVEVPIFKNRTEMEKTSISNRSKNVFTLSNIYNATKALLGRPGKTIEVLEGDETTVKEFWIEVAKNIPEWDLLIQNGIKSYELRQEYVHVHGVVLQSLGHMGEVLLKAHPNNWKEKLKVLSSLDWTRTNSDMWEGRCMQQSKIRKAKTNIILTTNILKEKLGLPLNEKEQEVEAQFHTIIGGEVDN